MVSQVLVILMKVLISNKFGRVLRILNMSGSIKESQPAWNNLILQKRPEECIKALQWSRRTSNEF